MILSIQFQHLNSFRNSTIFTIFLFSLTFSFAKYNMSIIFQNKKKNLKFILVTLKIIYFYFFLSKIFLIYIANNLVNLSQIFMHKLFKIFYRDYIIINTL